MEDKVDNSKSSLSERGAMRERQPSEFIKHEDLIIQKMAEKKDRIPKNYQHFEKFIKELVDGDPPQNVIFAIWNKLCLTEEKISGQKLPPPVIELSDDDNDEYVIISERPPESGEFDIYLSKGNYIPLNSGEPLVISDAPGNDKVSPKIEKPFKTSNLPPVPGIEEPRTTWYLPPVPVNEAPTTSASSSYSYPPCSSKEGWKNNFKMNLETNAFKDIPKDELSQQEIRKEKPILAVKPLKVEPGASTQSSKHKVVNSNEQQTRKRKRTENMTEEQFMIILKFLKAAQMIRLTISELTSIGRGETSA